MIEIPQHRRIVVGVDGSANSVAALRWALGEANRPGATEVWAVHAWPGKRRDAAEPKAAAVLGHDPQWRAAGSLLAAAVAAAGEVPQRVRVREIVDTGDVVPVLLWQAADADLLVLGSRHRDLALHGHTMPVSGPTARACRLRARCPVVVVSPTGRPSRTPDRPEPGPARPGDDPAHAATGGRPKPL